MIDPKPATSYTESSDYGQLAGYFTHKGKFRPLAASHGLKRKFKDRKINAVSHTTEDPSSVKEPSGMTNAQSIP